MNTKIIELVNRHEGFLYPNEIAVLTKTNYHMVCRDLEKIKQNK
ncbi:MAG TPA: hypothetical protein PLO36_01605 [Methanofastidiosum sp.]|nr:hypothetical protein [Methanofastidiosum sp.]HQQ48754.1 hypothetical protein [Methanofastidiosum sp.]